ncbi:MAG TPA: hypothetical protein VI316_07335 [Candidatus Dormibacteraeota bacterium]
MRPFCGLALLALGAGVTACGGQAATIATACTPAVTAATGPATTVTAGSVSVTMDRGVVNAGDTVTLLAHVTGPVRLTTDCTAPVQLVVVDSADVHVAAEAPPGVHGMPCGDLNLASGNSLDYEMTWTPDPTLPSGLYTVELTVGDLPGVDVHVELGTRAGQTC